MEGKRKITKAKGVEICADRIFSGAQTKDIVRELAEQYGSSRSAVEKWMKVARPIVEERQHEAEAIRARETEAAITESAKKLNLTRERVLEEYAKVAFMDIRKIFTVDGGLKPIQDIDEDAAGALAGIESYDEKSGDGEESLGTNRKVKVWDKVKALDSICRVLGYNAPTKFAPTDPSGNALGVIIQLPHNGREAANNPPATGLPNESPQQ